MNFKERSNPHKFENYFSLKEVKDFTSLNQKILYIIGCNISDKKK